MLYCDECQLPRDQCAENCIGRILREYKLALETIIQYEQNFVFGKGRSK